MSATAIHDGALDRLARPTPPTPRGTPRRNKEWTNQEKSLLRTHAVRGINALRQVLKGRTDHSIHGGARRFGVDIPRTTYRSDWRLGRIPVPKHCHPLVKRIYEEANAQGFYLKDLGARSGITPDIISKWGHQRHPHLESLAAVGAVLGMELAWTPLKDGAA